MKRTRHTIGLAVAACAALCCLGGIADLALAEPAQAPAPGASVPEAKNALARGQQIYKQQCAECHGDHGQGVKEIYSKPLIGDASLEQLTRRIEETMPEGDAAECVGPEAAAVAQFVYASFYSPEARAAALAQFKPDLQRLTVPQCRQTIVDLVGAYRKDFEKPYTDRRGLSLRFNGRHPTKEKNGKKIWVDRDAEGSEVFFEYSEASPYEDIDRAEKITATWTGSVLAEVSGEYEFVLRTPNGFNLWFNESDFRATPLIDGSVVSGTETREVKHNVYLVAGQAYPIRVQWMVSPKEPAASIELLYKTPGQPLQRVPARLLMPQIAPKVACVSTPFPPDDASLGYERGTTISAQWQEATVQAAIEVAGMVARDLDQLANIRPNAADRDEKIKEFCEDFVSRAIRRPLSDAERQLFIEGPFASAENSDQAAKRVVLLTLCSAQFLYPGAGVEVPDSYDVAARLALVLWDSLPDLQLLAAAESGELTSPEAIRVQAQRMLGDRRARTKLKGFFHHWLELDRAENVTKDETVFPEFDPTLLTDLHVSLDLFLDHVVWSEKSDYRELLLADYLFLNGRLRELYGVKDKKDKEENEAPAAADFEQVQIPGDRRTGVLTHPYLLTTLAYHNSTSPIHRGVFLTRNIVGRQLKPPPNAIQFSDAHFDPSLSMREKVTKFTSDSACMACHAIINPLGFSLEHFDGIGRWRTKEHDKPIDAESDFDDDAGDTVRLTGARDVAELAVNSPLSRKAFIRQLFQHEVKQDTSAYGMYALDNLETSFSESDCHIRNLLAEIAVMASSYGLPAATTSTTKPAAAD